MEIFCFIVFYFLVCEWESGWIIGECGFYYIDKWYYKGELFYFLFDDMDK